MSAGGFRIGDRVRFSPAGREKVRSMPEAWGLHRALSQDEIGEVVAVSSGEEGERLSVEFPSGGAYFWDAACFEPAEPHEALAP